MAYEPLYVAYLIYFNRDRDYFECHEVLEELWLQRDRDPLYKALLQVAVGLFHFRRGNLRGARMMLERSSGVLKRYPQVMLGIRLGKLAAEAEEMADGLAPEAYAVDPLPYRDLTIEIADGELAEAVRVRSAILAANPHPRRVPQRQRPPNLSQE